VSKGSTWVNPNQHRIKIIIIIVLKIDLEINPRKSPSYGSRESTHVTVWIKIVIIIVLKPDSRVDRSNASDQPIKSVMIL